MSRAAARPAIPAQLVKVCVPKEIASGERRVALVPEVVAKLVDAGNEVLVQSGAGLEANLTDSAYQESGATVSAHKSSTPRLRRSQRYAHLSATIAGIDELALLPAGSVLVGFLNPLASPDLVRRLAEGRITSFAMEVIRAPHARRRWMRVPPRPSWRVTARPCRQRRSWASSSRC